MMNNKNNKDYQEWLKKVKLSKERDYSFESASGEEVELLYHPDKLSDDIVQS